MMSKRERRELERMRLDGYGPTRIAEELELSVNTVKYHIKNAIRLLYSQLEPYLLLLLLLG